MAEYSPERRVLPARLRLSCYTALALAALVLCVIVSRAQPLTPATTDKPGSSMNQFVFLFRQSSRLSEADQKRRAEEVKAWARQQNTAGHRLDPRTLGEQKHRIAPNGKNSLDSQTDETPLTAILFAEAHDFAEAVKIAESHPALRYGVITVEVRPWSSPLAPPAQRRSWLTKGIVPNDSLCPSYH
jgi:hypothetical protein